MRYRFNDKYDPAKIKQLVDQTNVVGNVIIYAACEPSHSQKERLAEIMHKQYGVSAGSIVYKIDHSLIGGLRMHIGDLVIDNTIKHRLERIKEAMQKPEHIATIGFATTAEQREI